MMKAPTTAEDIQENKELWFEFWKNRDSFPPQERLIEAYMPLARKILSRLLIRLPSFVRGEDLLNSALIGLHDAICRFDPVAGTSFEAFATRRVRGAILDELRACDPLTRTQRDLLGDIEKTITDWMVKHSATPETDQIAQALNMKTNDLMSLMDRAQPWLSLDVPVAVDGNTILLGDVLTEGRRNLPDQEAGDEEFRVFLRKAFRQLETREQKILYLYYYEDLRLREIAELFELTEARVCQLHALAVAKLKAAITRMEKTG